MLRSYPSLAELCKIDGEPVSSHQMKQQVIFPRTETFWNQWAYFTDPGQEPKESFVSDVAMNGAKSFRDGIGDLWPEPDI